MKEQLNISKTFRIITILLIFIGAGTFLFGLFFDLGLALVIPI